jgi:hypothetical protein
VVELACNLDIWVPEVAHDDDLCANKREALRESLEE